MKVKLRIGPGERVWINGSKTKDRAAREGACINGIETEDRAGGKGLDPWK